MPYIPIRLLNNTRLAERVVLVDTSATVNVMPYPLGVELGFTWNDSKAIIPLGGNVRSLAIPISMTGVIGNLDPTELIFAWAGNNIPPLLLGQLNFFQEFHVCFYQNQNYFEIASK
ncbi:MAG: hypothetical protein FD167_3546 [bacterium]|nr:MAG: hypothetical protein FD167_3546 [bacterium]